MDRIVKVVKAEVVMWACQPSRTQSLQCIGKRHQQFRISPHPLEIVTGREALKEVLEKWRLSRAWPGEKNPGNLGWCCCVAGIFAKIISYPYNINLIFNPFCKGETTIGPWTILVWSTRTVPLQPGRLWGSDSGGVGGGTGCNQQMSLLGRSATCVVLSRSFVCRGDCGIMVPHGIMEHLAFFFRTFGQLLPPADYWSRGVLSRLLHQELNKPIEHSRLLQLAEGLYRQGGQQDDFFAACKSIFFLNSILTRPRRHIGVLSSSYVQQAAWFKLLCPGAKLWVWLLCLKGFSGRKSKASAAWLLFRRRRMFGLTVPPN